MVYPWKILPIDLSQEITDLLPLPDYERVYLIFSWKTIPLGHKMILSEQLPMPAAEVSNLAAQIITPAVGCHLFEPGFRESIAAYNDGTFSCETESVNWDSLITLDRSLETLDKKITKSNTQSLSNEISVIICTRDRPEQLAKCLASLQSLSYPPREIIVVDNAPKTTATKELVSHFSDIRYILEPKAGLSVARNTGIAHAVGEIIAFTDDDVVVHPDWIFHLGLAFKKSNLMAVTGMVLPGELETESQQIFEVELGSFGSGYRRRVFDDQFWDYNRFWGVPVWRIGAGANMAFRRHIFAKVGEFEERLGAGAAGCSEDSEMWYRILAEGGICCYEPTAIVFHYHRKEMTQLRQQLYHYMRGHVTALLIQFARYQHGGNLYRLFFDLPKYYLRLFLSGIVYGFGQKQKLLLSEILGCLAGISFYLRHR